MSTPLNFTAAMSATCADMAHRLPELRHIDMSLVAVGFRQARRRVKHGLQASLTPMRFEGGADTGTVNGRHYRCTRLRNNSGHECLYLLNFYLPRFFDHPFEEKLTTVLHELWHIGPKMDGDIRRLAGRCYAHGPSQAGFDAHAAELARRWLAAGPAPGLYDYMEKSYEEIIAEHGTIIGDKYRTPKLLPYSGAA